MHDESQHYQTAPPSRFARAIKRTVIAVIFLVLLGVGIAVALHFIPIDLAADVTFEAQAGKIEATNNISTSTAVTSSSYDHLTAGRLAVFNRTDHPLTNRVAKSLLEQLRDIEFVEAVDQLDPSDPPLGERLYDLYVTLEMPSFTESGLIVTGRTVDAELVMTLGQTLFDSHRGYRDHLTPPGIRIELRSTLEHHSVTTGYETASAKYKLAADNITEQLAKALTENLNKWSAEHGLQPPLPAALTPDYRPVPDDLPLPEADDLAITISGNELMRFNRTVWTFHTLTPVETLTNLQAQLKEAGWRSSNRLTPPENIDPNSWPAYFRASRDGQVYEAFEHRDSWPGGYSNGRPENQPVLVVIEYTDRMTREDFRPILESLLEADADPLMLLSLDSKMSGDQHSRLMQRMTGMDSLPLDAELSVIRWLERRDRKDEAIERLSRAYLTDRLTGGEKKSEIRKAAEKLTGEKKWTPPVPTAEQLETMGARPLAPDGTISAERGLDQPLVVYHYLGEDDDGSDDGELRLIAFTVSRADIPEGIYKFSLRRAGWTTGSGAMSSTPYVKRDQHRPATASESPDGSDSHVTPITPPWTASLHHGHNDLNISGNATEVEPQQFEIEVEIKRDEPKVHATE